MDYREKHFKLPSWREAWLWAREPLAVIAFMLAANTALAQTFYVPSGSMEPTLAIGDAIVGTKFPYGYSRYSLPLAFGPASEKRFLGKTPKRGDVIVFRLPSNPSVTYVKRLIGLPGDHIQMHAGHLSINGKDLPLKPDGTGLVENTSDGTYREVARYIETLPGGIEHPIFKWQWDGMYDNTKEFVVPANHVFMMGDNRDDSSDSRVPVSLGGVGFVPMENLVARAEVVVGSYDFLNAPWFKQVRLSRFFTGIN